MNHPSELAPATEAGGLTDCGLLHCFVERSASRWPDHVAVDIPTGKKRPERVLLTYAALQADSNALAARLRPLIDGECVMGILLPRTSDRLFVTQLAVLKAGAAYTCLDPLFPDERIAEILEDAAATVLLTDSEGSQRLNRRSLETLAVIHVDEEWVPVAGKMEAVTWLERSSLAYVIYTSGTTGRPKGVMIEHQSIANLVASDLEDFRLTPSDRVAQGSSAAYDSSVEETWLAFAAGATLVVMDDDTVRLGPDLIGWLQHERITVFCPPPTLLRATGCENPESALPGLKLLYVGGEPLPRDVADRWSAGRELVNGYGPTECTVTCLRERIEVGGAITIGKPVSGATARVLNDQLEEVPPGEQGELCMGGVGLSRGYRNHPDLTAEKFIQHPEYGRLYRTGDLVHCDAEGRFFYHGRIDSQVKLRGYRIELGEIESRLAVCPGVCAAACQVRGTDENAVIVAFVVAVDPAMPPGVGDLKEALARTLPGYMVPARIGFLEQLPTTVGGKLNRAALPPLDDVAEEMECDAVMPRNPMEVRLAGAFHDVLGLTRPVSIHSDFFHDLGGDSLRAARLVTLLRKDPASAWITVRDVYESRTVAELAGRAVHSTQVDLAIPDGKSAGGTARPFLVTVAQTVWLIGVLIVASVSGWWLFFECLPQWTARLGLIPFVVLAPLLAVIATAIYTPIALGAAVLAKRLLIGRYTSLRAPVWGSFYLRHWIVQQMVRLVPWRSLEGTVYQQYGLRLLGARIGKRVHIHRGVDLLQGGWDLLDIGDDVTLSQDAAVRLVYLEAGEIVIGPVSLGDGSTLETRAGLAGHTVLENGAYLAALSSLPAGGRIPAGERWDGIPARPAGHAPVPPAITDPSRVLSPQQHGLALMAAKAGLVLLICLPLEILTISAFLAAGLSQEQAWSWVSAGTAGWTPWLLFLGIPLTGVPLTLAWMAVLSRLLGKVPETASSCWGTTYLRVWLKTGLVDGAGNWLTGTLFWPVWLRWSGMKIGSGCEISTIIDVVPELIEIGPETFFADGIYLGGPQIQQGVVMLARTKLGRNTFLGNHVVVPAGQQLPDDILIGIATVADDRLLRSGSSWFGHAPFELPRREVIAMDRSLTHEPSAVRYWNRVFWEALRFALPIIPLFVFAGWSRILARAEEVYPAPAFWIGIVPLASFGAAAFLCIFILALKWALLGRVRPGQHALWSCWCSRWDFLYVAWGQHARPALEKLEGTLLLSWYLRAMGMKLGKRVVLGPGFSQVVDPDMLVIEDGATVNAMFQAHTFEDRVLKTDHVFVRKHATLGSATVPLYGAEIGERCHVAAHSVIMKREHLLPGLHYEGAPSRTGTRSA